MRSIAVFCGSNFGASDAYAQGASALGAALARRSLNLIYGGAHKGLMGVVADAALAAGGSVTGIITRRLAEHGHAHPHLSAIEVVEDMTARKREMTLRADAFVILPGGIGTLEELFAVWATSQIEGHGKPIGLLDIREFFTPLLSCIEHMVEQRFLPAAHRDMLIVERSPEVLLERFASYQPVTTPKWL